MFFTGIGTALPHWKYSQPDCWQALSASPRFQELQPRSQALLRKVLLGANGIASRHFALPTLEEAFQICPDRLHRHFTRHAPVLAATAARRALEDAGKTTDDVDAVLVSTCTGYLCPGLTSYVSEQLGLPRMITALDLVGQGCGAALPNLGTAAELIRAGQHRVVLSICVEVCSAAIYLDDDPGVLISACLFGDGAAAIIMTDRPNPDKRQVRWRDSATVTEPRHRDLLRFEQRDGLLRNILTPDVPELAAQYAQVVFDRVAKQTGIREMGTWLWHAGGRNVLHGLQAQFGLHEEDLALSASVLNRVGNISSPFVLFVLQDALSADRPGGHWWMGSFGAGFSSHGALLDVE